MARRMVTEVRRPACMTDPEYELWCSANSALSWPSMRSKTPCRDCPASFAQEMRADGRCDGTPGPGYSLQDTPLRSRWREQKRAQRRQAAA
jgi:hypothetical protein